jgi:hypothetical protein
MTLSNKVAHSGKRFSNQARSGGLYRDRLWAGGAPEQNVWSRAIPYLESEYWRRFSSGSSAMKRPTRPGNQRAFRVPDVSNAADANASCRLAPGAGCHLGGNLRLFTHIRSSNPGRREWLAVIRPPRRTGRPSGIFNDCEEGNKNRGCGGGPTRRRRLEDLRALQEGTARRNPRSSRRESAPGCRSPRPPDSPAPASTRRRGY